MLNHHNSYIPKTPELCGKCQNISDPILQPRLAVLLLPKLWTHNRARNMPDVPRYRNTKQLSVTSYKINAPAQLLLTSCAFGEDPPSLCCSVWVSSLAGASRRLFVLVLFFSSFFSSINGPIFGAGLLL